MEALEPTLFPPGRVDEHQLVVRILGGDSAAERVLYDAHVDRVYRLAFRMTGDDDLAQDCTQEAFIRAFSRLREWRGEAALGTWIHSITVSVTLNALRKSKRFQQREADLDEATHVASPQREAEPDLKERMKRAIDALPERYRTVFVMHDVEGYTHEEIGAVLDAPAGTCKARLSRARSKLREALADFAGGFAG
jgi:RNA polymerase sigma-70 factor (ECF subfamily)